MANRPKSSGLDGIINLDKPAGISSAKALYRVRDITGQRKSGHSGTLDPGASGVLVLCMGRATKLVESIMDQPGYQKEVLVEPANPGLRCSRPPANPFRSAAVPCFLTPPTSMSPV